MKYRIIIFGIIGLLVVAGALAFVFGRRDSGGELATLKFWGTDDAANWQPIISAYQAANPKIIVKYTRKDPLKYEKKW